MHHIKIINTHTHARCHNKRGIVIWGAQIFALLALPWRTHNREKKKKRKINKRKCFISFYFFRNVISHVNVSSNIYNKYLRTFRSRYFPDDARSFNRISYCITINSLAQWHN